MRFLAGVLFSMACLAAHALELVTEDDPPHNMLRNGKVVGVATEKLEEAFRRSGIAEHIELMPWARAYQSALHRAGYCVFSAARTAEREPLFKWIGPIAAMDWTLYARADNPARPGTLDEVRKEVIGGYLQDVISVWLADHGYRVETAPNDGLNPNKLMMGHIKYWASSRPRATALLTQGPGRAHRPGTDLWPYRSVSRLPPLGSGCVGAEAECSAEKNERRRHGGQYRGQVRAVANRAAAPVGLSGLRPADAVRNRSPTCMRSGRSSDRHRHITSPC